MVAEQSQSSTAAVAPSQSQSSHDLEQYLAKLTQGTPLSESEVQHLCNKARETLTLEANVSLSHIFVVVVLSSNCFLTERQGPTRERTGDRLRGHTWTVA